MGQNAIHNLLEPLQKLFTIFPIPKKEIWETTCNLGVIQGGTAVNQVPNRCAVKLDIRFTPDENPDKIIKKIASIFKKQKIKINFIEPPIFSDKNNKFIKKFARVVRQVTKKTRFSEKDMEVQISDFYHQKNSSNSFWVKR